jgi:acetyl/propionyl-CoA carboxylase alpha subunit
LRKDAEPPFRRVLVANRGEIAVRIIRAARDLGMEVVAVYSDADVDAAHVRLADDAVRIGPPPPSESYLRIDAIVDAALASGAEAIHPGYGFLAERAAFGTACIDAGLVFVGPAPATIAALGDKLAARRVAASVDVAPVPGTLEPAAVDRADAVESVLAEASAVGFPLLVKAAAGGGGRGMRRVARGADLPAALAAASAEAMSAFGDGTVYLERMLGHARHVEVQLLGDRSGAVVAIGERECSIQRRHQKLVEEAPAPGIATGARRDLHERAVRIGVAAGLENAATCEFLLDEAGEPWFLEVNTRLQVEHGVTEMVSGVDIVEEQFLLASGRPLSGSARSAAAAAAEPASHAIEVRLTAEDPENFQPTPGIIRHWVMPAGPGIRVDTGSGVGDRVAPFYDSLVAKIIAHGADRETAIRRLRRALDETEVAGVQTSLPFHRFVVRDPTFLAAALSTDWVAVHWDGSARREAVREAAVRAALVAVSAASSAAATTSTESDQGDRPVGLGTDERAPWRVAGREALLARWPP